MTRSRRISRLIRKAEQRLQVARGRNQSERAARNYYWRSLLRLAERACYPAAWLEID